MGEVKNPPGLCLKLAVSRQGSEEEASHVDHQVAGHLGKENADVFIIWSWSLFQSVCLSPSPSPGPSKNPLSDVGGLGVPITPACYT